MLKKLVHAMTILGLAVLVLPASAAQPTRNTTYRFVGYATTTPRLGNEGFVAMHMSCQEDFEPLARMCTTEEFWLSPNAEYPDEFAWIHMVGTRSGSLHDFTRGINLIEGSCAGWSSTVGDGSAVSPAVNGQFSSVPCGVVARPVTCCAPLR